MSRRIGRGSVAAAALGFALLFGVPAAGPASKAARFDLWSGTWHVAFEYPSRRADETITLRLGSDERVRNSGGEITVFSNPVKGLSMEALLVSPAGTGAPAGQSLLNVRFTPGSSDLESSDFGKFTGAVFDLGGRREAIVFGFYERGGPERAGVTAGIARSRRVADVGERVEFRITLANNGPSGMQRGAARARVVLNVDPSSARVVPRRVRRCDEERGRFAHQTIYSCVLLAMGPTLGDPVLRLVVGVPRYLADRRLDLDLDLRDANDRDKVRVGRLLRGAAITILQENRQPPPPSTAPNLAGKWLGNDGARFTVIQRGREVRWRGRSADNGATWTHNFRGFIRGHFLVGNFQDVTPGRLRNRGPLALRIVSRTRMDWVARVGDVSSFPTTTRRWKRCSASGCPAPELRSWAGTWSTTFGTMKLAQSGNSVTGTYTHDSGQLTGKVSGRVLSGAWTEAPTRRPPTDTGKLEFTMSADGRSFTGRWTYASDPAGAWRPGWNGTRGG